MSILSFDKPKRATAGNAGKYVSNMSVKSMAKWKAKRIKGDDPRIEIRKTIFGFDPILKQKSQRWGGNGDCSAQILLIVRPDGSVVMSANGRMAYNCDTWVEMNIAVEEAKMIFEAERDAQ